MASAKLFRMDGTEAGSVALNATVFDVEMNPVLVHEVVLALQASKRQGNADTKTRKDVSGGGIKPYRQKGTGNARHGSSRESQMRGGGTVWGPHPRSYRQDVPIAFRRKALCCALSDRVRGEALCVLENFACDAPKTKPMASMLDKLSAAGRRTLIIMADADKNAVLSTRNIPKVSVRTASDVNALDVMTAARVMVAQDALAKLEERLS